MNISVDHFSFFSLFFHADILVRGVMILLVFLSIWSWFIIFFKILQLIAAQKGIDSFRNAFLLERSVERLYRRINPRTQEAASSVFLIAVHEWRLEESLGPSSVSSLKNRLDFSISACISRYIEKFESGLLFLATMGSSATFIGLFGTVWGIMSSFQSIAASHETNLSVVAPGIAEALAATALGLVVAIPDVIAYNFFSRKSNKLAHRLESFGDEVFSTLVRSAEESSPSLTALESRDRTLRER